MLHSRQKAVALRCKSDEELPEVLAKGVGDLAREILTLAEEFEIPIVESEREELEDLMSSGAREALSGPELDLVAEVIAFLIYFDKDFARKYPSFTKYSAS